MEVQTETAGVSVQDGQQSGRKDWYVSSFLEQINRRSPGVVINPGREGVTVVRCPGVLGEELEGIDEEDEFGEEEGVEPGTSTMDSLADSENPQSSTSKASARGDTSASLPTVKSSRTDKAIRFKGSEEPQADDITLESGSEGNATLIIDGDVEERIHLNPGLSLARAKVYLSAKRGVDPENIKLTRVDKTIEETDTLGRGDIRVDFGADVAASERLTCGTRNRSTPKFKVVDVKFQREDGSWVTSKVALINCGARKRYLGGYRNKKTGEVYYHVWSQTNPKVNPAKMTTREVQTNLPTENTGINTVRSRLTQTGTPGIWMSNYTDRILKPRPYTSYDEAKKTMCPEKAAEIIQNAWRHYSRKKAFLCSVKEIHNLWKLRSRFEYVTKLEFQSQHIRLMITEGYPTNRNDFSNLFGVVNQWAVEEGMRLLATKTTGQ
uniref:IQ and ubiquitin-like domain-containing protein n=1 Tax=Lygus hesperus TaxID=30085 RepID=A0A0A9X9A6_LYGHE